MAYRKTEKVLASLEARRNSILASAIDVIAKSGMEGLTTDAIAERAEISVGLMYQYFPDKSELLAAVTAQLLARDIDAMRKAIGTRKQAQALGIGIRVYTSRVVSNYRIVSEIAKVPSYRLGIKREFKSLIQAVSPPESPAILASVVAGAILETAGSLGPKGEEVLTACLLRVVGVSANRRSKAIA